MNQRNCPNCGAPYNIELSTCPYCGTSYFDMSAIDINDRRPFYLKLKMSGMVFTSKVKVDPDVQIEVKEDNCYAYGRYGERITKIVTSRNLDIDMHFTSVHDFNEPLYTLEVKE